MIEEIIKLVYMVIWVSIGFIFGLIVGIIIGVTGSVGSLSTVPHWMQFTFIIMFAVGIISLFIVFKREKTTQKKGSVKE